MEGLFGLNILSVIIEAFVLEALPFLVLLGVICGGISMFYDFLRPFISVNKY